MIVRNFVVVAVAVATLAAVVAGCGYKGPLTLPEEAGPVVIRPAPPAPPAPQKPEDDEQARPATEPAAAPEGSPAGG